MKSRIISFALLLALLASLFSFGAYAEEENEGSKDEPYNFVLLIDCSMTMGTNDKDNLCMDAIKNFIDTLPTDNAKITVIAFGYKTEQAFEFNADNEKDKDRFRVETLFGPEELSDSDTKSKEKRLIQNVHNSHISDTETFSPIGHALEAAVETLDNNGVSANRACIILVSDGVRSSANDNNGGHNAHIDLDYKDQACDLAKEKNWKIYGIELNYANNNTIQKEEAHELFKDISDASGVTSKYGVNACEDPEGVYEAFQYIFADFFGRDTKVEEITLPKTKSFTVPELASETTINIFGSGVTDVEIKTPSGESFEVSDSGEFTVGRTEYSAAVEEGYFSVKLFCPEEGEWEATINGEGNARAMFNTITLQEMSLVTEANPVNNAKINKSDSIVLNTCFSYNGKKQTALSFYDNCHAYLTVKDAEGEEKQYPMEADENGYSYTIELAGYHKGTIELTVSVENDIFKGGVKENKLTYNLNNQPVEKVNLTKTKYEGVANSEFEPIEETQMFKNPDNDVIEYVVECPNDLGASFECERTDEGYLIIKSGNNCGDYKVKLGAKDCDMDDYAWQDITLSVTNDAPEKAKNLKKETLVINAPIFYKTAKTESEIDLNEYFTDPEGWQLSYSYEPGKKEVAEVSIENNILKLTPKAKGTGTIQITASDGFNEVSQGLEIKVEGGLESYIKHYGMAWVVALAIFVVAMIVFVILLLNKKVKGTWDINVNDSGAAFNPDPLAGFEFSSFAHGDKGKLTLEDLLSDITRYLDPTVYAELIAKIPTYGTATSKVQLIGVMFGKGLKLKLNSLKNDQYTIEADSNGDPVPVNSTVKHKIGACRIVITDNTTGDRLEVTLKLL